MDTLFKRLYRTNRVLGSVFGYRVRPWIASGALVSVRSLVSASMALDRLFYPQLRRVQVESPVIIVGNPRNGTTFLQRFLCENGVGAGLELHRMLYPSLILQKAVKPVLPALERLSPARFHDGDVHETDLTAVETEDAGLFFRHVDGFFLYGFLLAFDEDDMFDAFDPKKTDRAGRDFDWLDALWRRNLLASGADRVVGKIFSLGARLPAFIEKYPDARILYLARQPEDAIPSNMSLITGVLDRAFGFWALPEAVRERYLDRLYKALVQSLQRFHDDYASGRVGQQNVHIVQYDRLMTDFENTMDGIFRFIGHEADDTLQQALERQGAHQRTRRSRHQYDPAMFGLDREQIRRDCAFFYDAFL
ncbi:sulfotransferase [Salaquimonas pukyongi]|uniref:sulfotransferase n=1 Tax=Salaquimonas pukyongi TaxID=2712698 RepID=UPI00096BB559|nr:sulfotransferase [Salaquimonas pukyongi]